MCNLVHYVRAIHGLCQLLPASGTLSGIVSDAGATAKRSFLKKNPSYFRKDFKILFADKEGDMQVNIATTKKTKIQNYAHNDHN